MVLCLSSFCQSLLLLFLWFHSLADVYTHLHVLIDVGCSNLLSWLESMLERHVMWCTVTDGIVKKKFRTHRVTQKVALALSG